MADLASLARLLVATTGQLRAELAALDEDGASFHPAPGEWCAKEVVGHLTEADRRGFAGRVREIMAGDPLEAWDQAAVAAARDDCSRPWADVLAEFEAGRTEGLVMLGRLDQSDLDRAGLHPEVGELRIRDVLHEWPFHDRDHLKQLLQNTRAMLWPDLGNARTFTELHAAD